MFLLKLVPKDHKLSIFSTLGLLVNCEERNVEFELKQEIKVIFKEILMSVYFK